MAKKIHVRVGEITKHFEDLEDPRSEVNRRHPLVSVVVIGLMAVLAGASGPTAIAAWANDKKELLRKVLPLPNGIPQKDVYRRVFSALKPEAFRACFVSWLQSLEAKRKAVGCSGERIYAVDGKTARRSHDRKKGLGPLHTVSVWASASGLSLAQVATEAKSNEITAIPELLRLVDLEGAIVTIDAIGTQKQIAKQIVESGGDYVLALKRNQKVLHEAVANYIEEQEKKGFAEVEARCHHTEEKGHGREETRSYVQMKAPKELPGFASWKGLKTIGKVTRRSVCQGKETSETRYYISSLGMGVKRFAQAVRSHWGIENSCHWILDVTYREDDSRIRDRRLAENMSWFNRFSLSLLKQHPSKESIAMKRRHCGWNEAFLMEVLTGNGS